MRDTRVGIVYSNPISSLFRLSCLYARHHSSSRLPLSPNAGVLTAVPIVVLTELRKTNPDTPSTVCICDTATE